MINIIHLVVMVTLPVLISALCAANEFECYNGICIPDTQLCDNSFDCISYEDENTTNCPAVCSGACTEGQYQCTDCSCATSQTECPSSVTTEAQIHEPADKTKMILMIVLPILCVCIVALVILLVYYIKKKKLNRVGNQTPANTGDTETSLEPNDTTDIPPLDVHIKQPLPPIFHHC